MTGRTHDQIAAAGALAIPAVALAIRHPLPIDASAILLCGALATSRAPDYTEPLAHTAHRTWTHWLPTGLLVALAFTLALAMIAPHGHRGFALAFGTGMLVGWWMHSLADGLTDSGCWILRRRRQALLPRRFRIHVYTITKRRNRWTGQTTTAKRPSRGERTYFRGAQLATFALAGLQVVTFAHSIAPPT